MLPGRGVGWEMGASRGVTPQPDRVAPEGPRASVYFPNGPAARGEGVRTGLGDSLVSYRDVVLVNFCPLLTEPRVLETDVFVAFTGPSAEAPGPANPAGAQPAMVSGESGGQSPGAVLHSLRPLCRPRGVALLPPSSSSSSKKTFLTSSISGGTFSFFLINVSFRNCFRFIKKLPS